MASNSLAVTNKQLIKTMRPHRSRCTDREERSKWPDRSCTKEASSWLGQHARLCTHLHSKPVLSRRWPCDHVPIFKKSKCAIKRSNNAEQTGCQAWRSGDQAKTSKPAVHLDRNRSHALNEILESLTLNGLRQGQMLSNAKQHRQESILGIAGDLTNPRLAQAMPDL